MEKEKTAKLRTIVLYSSGHLGSATCLNRMVHMPELEIVGVVKSKPLSLTGKTAKKVARHLEKIGWRFGWLLSWQQIIQVLGYAISLLLPVKRELILPAWKISRLHGFPVHRVTNINHDESIRIIRDLNPDIIISAYFNQIIADDVIALAKIGILNIHPGWLPAYRGVMAYFWVLKNGSDSAGVSVHWIDEGIDTGELVARRKFRINKGMTQQKVLILTAVIGSVLVRRIARKLLKGETPAVIAVADESSGYYSMPGEKEFSEYFREKRFFRIRDLLGFLSLRGKSKH